jgi:autotransporter-associated beta strand protein
MTHGAVNLAGNANVTLNVDVDATGGVNSTGAGTMAITGAISGAGDFVQSGAGQSTLSGANTYTGSTRVSAGTLLAAADNVIPGDLNMNGRTDTLHSIVQTGGDFELRGADITLLNNSSLTNLTGNSGQSVVRLVDGVTLTSIGGISQLGDNVRIAFDTQGSSLADISASINTGDGNGSIDKLGTGTLRLTSNASAYGGGNRFENGLVEFTSIANRDTPSSLGDADFEDVLQIGSNATPATLRMIGTAGGSTSDRAVQLGDAGATIEVAESSRVLTLNGVISNHNTSGSLTTGGQGSIVFGGANCGFRHPAGGCRRHGPNRQRGRHCPIRQHDPWIRHGSRLQLHPRQWRHPPSG